MTSTDRSTGSGAVWAALVASVGTLLCCVLPSLLVVAGHPEHRGQGKASGAAV